MSIEKIKIKSIKHLNSGIPGTPYLIIQIIVIVTVYFNIKEF